MAANPNVVPDGGSGAGETPSQPVSPQSQPAIEGDVTKLLTGLGEKIGNLESQLRGLQGRQDKSENNFRAQLARLNQYKQGGLSDEEALAEMEADDASTQRWQTLEQKIDSLAARFEGIGNTQAAQQMVATVFSEYGLDPRDPFVAGKLAGQNITSKEQAELLAGRIVRDQRNAPQTNAAQQSAMPGGANAGMTQESADAQTLRLAELYKNYSQNKDEIAAIEATLSAAGVIKRR